MVLKCLRIIIRPRNPVSRGSGSLQDTLSYAIVFCSDSGTERCQKKSAVSAVGKWVKIEKLCDEIKQREISCILLLTQRLHLSQVRDFYYLLSPDIKETVGSLAFLISYYYRLSNILTCVLRRLKEKLIISVSCLFCGYWQSKPTK